MSTLTTADQQADILSTLRRLEGRGTVGDVVADSGLPGDDVRAGLKELLESHRGHLEVSDSGELVYEFDPKLIERGSEPLLSRLKRKIAAALTTGFKAWIVITLVVYFVLFVVLVIAALLASQRGSDSRGGGWGGRGGRRGGHSLFPNVWFWYWIWGPRWRIGRPYYGHRWERTLDKEDRVPFYKKVFAFVFGPDRPKATRKQLDRSTLRLIRSRAGVITPAELVQHTSLTSHDAEEEMARLLGSYDGEAAVSPDGELVYAFPQVMTSAHGRVATREPNPTWLRLEYPLELTGNTTGANALVAGINGFNLLAAASAPWFIFPRLGIGGPAAFVALVLVPVVFSALFFGLPLLRMLGVKLENRRREGRNVRRVLLGLVYRRSLGSGLGIDLDEAHRFVASKLESQMVERESVEGVLHDLAAEWDGDISVGDGGEVRFTFPAIRRQFEASERVRQTLQLEKRALGDIVFSTSDTDEEAHKRDVALFDRSLSGADVTLSQYLPSADRIAFEDDYEVVAFDEELKLKRGAG